MSRLPRIHVPAGYYHVIVRGNYREKLFTAQTDAMVLNDIVADAANNYDARIHAYCWMTDRLQLLVQIGEVPLGKLMQRIAVRYSRYRHRQIKRTGHLFEQRYRTKLVDTGQYAVPLLRYIHRDPVVAGLVSDPMDYRWSSHRAYLGQESVSWLTTDVMLALFGATAMSARTAYGRKMRQPSCASEQRLWDDAHPADTRVLGGDRFLASLPTRLTTHAKPRAAETLEQVAQRICGTTNISVQNIRSPARTRALTDVRLAIALHAVDNRVATIAQIAEFFGRDASGVSKLLARRVRST